MFKFILGAAALTIAAPVFAQTAPAGDPHAGHAGQVQATGEAQPSAPTGKAGMLGHGEKMDCCKKCCDEENKGASKMPCCDKAKESGPEAPAGHQH